MTKIETQEQYDALCREQLSRLVTARMSLVMKKPHIGSLAYRMDFKFGLWLEHAGTDGRNCYFNPLFCATLTYPELAGVIEHETYHNALGHPWRKGDRIHDIANQAMDYAINGDIVKAGAVLPTPHLLDAKYTGKAFEVIYAELFEEACQKPQGGAGGDQQGEGEGDKPAHGDPKPGHIGQSSGQWGEVFNPAPATSVKDEADWRAAVVSAVKAAKQRGVGAGLLERAAVEFARPKVDWRAVLRRFAQQNARDDYTLAQPSRRHLARGFYLPSRHSHVVPPICVIKDISGSTSFYQREFDIEIKSVIEEVQPVTTHVLYVDDSVRRADAFERGEVLIETVQGNGGTDMTAGLKHIDKHDLQPCCAIVLTDGETPFGDEPDYPVLFVMTTDIIAPFGETIKMIDE